MTKKLPKRGNIIAQAAIMRKGGVHEKSRTAKRQSSKRKLRKEVNNYMVSEHGDQTTVIVEKYSVTIEHLIGLLNVFLPNHYFKRVRNETFA